MRDDEFYVGGGDLYLLKAVFDAADCVGHVREPATVKNGLLDAGHAAKAQFLADLADLAEKTEIQNQRFIVAAA